jgi:hypothetical protein
MLDELGGIRGLRHPAQLLVIGSIGESATERQPIDGRSRLIASPGLQHRPQAAFEGVHPLTEFRRQFAPSVISQDGLDCAPNDLGCSAGQLAGPQAERTQQCAALTLCLVLMHRVDVAIDATEPMLERLVALVEQVDLADVHRRAELASRFQLVELLHELME